MAIVSKTVEVCADAATILAIVMDFEAYPQWNEEVTGIWILHRYEDGRPSQLRLDASYAGYNGSFIQAVYYPNPTQIRTVLQQGDLFRKQEQLFSVVELGNGTTLLTVDLDVETEKMMPKMVVKKAAHDTLDYLAANLKRRAEQLTS